MTVAAATWLLNYSIMYFAATESVAYVWARLGQSGVTFIPAGVYHFTVGSLQIYSRYRKRVWLFWFLSAVFSVTVLSGDNFLSGVNHFWWGFYPRYEWLTIPFLIFFFGLMALSLRHYWREYHVAAPGVGKLRSKALFIAFCVSYIGSVDYLAAFGIPLYPFGHIPVLGFVTLAARAVWRYRLVDITPAFAATEIINAMADALLVLDNEGIVRVANGAACQLFDKPDKQLPGRYIHTLTPAISNADLELDRLILTGTLREFESTLPTARGGIAAVSTSSFAMRDEENRPIAFVCIIRDVTQQKKARQDIQRHTERQAALYEINLATTSTLELRAVLNVLLEKLTALVPQAATTILLFAETKLELIKVAARGIDEEAWKAHGTDIGARSPHPVLETREAISLPNIQANRAGPDSEYFRKSGFVSYLGLPLMAQDRVLGILSFYCRQKRHFGEEEIHFLRTLAGQAAAAIQNSQLYEQMKKQAIDLEKVSKVKDEFLGVMSHELRTPLNIIAGLYKDCSGRRSGRD